MTKPAILLAACAAACAAGCTPDPAPSAAIESVTPDQLNPDDDAADDLTIALRYDDGDGDLGGGVAEVHDCRADGVTIELAIPPIAADPGQHITGALELHVNDIGELAAGPLPAACATAGVKSPAAGTAVFCVVLVDRAGHRGAGECTASIAIAVAAP